VLPINPSAAGGWGALFSFLKAFDKLPNITSDTAKIIAPTMKLIIVVRSRTAIAKQTPKNDIRACFLFTIFSLIVKPPKKRCGDIHPNKHKNLHHQNESGGSFLTVPPRIGYTIAQM
jgi:hypothetical protein